MRITFIARMCHLLAARREGNSMVMAPFSFNSLSTLFCVKRNTLSSQVRLSDIPQVSIMHSIHITCHPSCMNCCHTSHLTPPPSTMLHPFPSQTKGPASHHNPYKYLSWLLYLSIVAFIPPPCLCLVCKPSLNTPP